MPRLLLLASAIGGLFALEARAVTIDFNTNNDFTNNFHAYPVANGAYAQSAATGNLTWTTVGAQTGTFFYDTNGSASGGVTNFTPGAGSTLGVSFDFSTSVANSSVGIYFGGARGALYSTVFNINHAGNNDRLRFFGNTSNGTTGTVGTQLTTNVTANSGTNTNGDVVLNSGGWTVNTTYHAQLLITYTSATTIDVTFTISDPYAVSGQVPSFSITATGLAVDSTLNEIGFRTGMASAGGVITIDNLTIAPIPEPASLALLGGLAALGLVATRRRRRL